MPRYDLSGKTALITGAARGIGFGTAEAMIRRGANVVVVDLDEGASQEAAGRLHAERAIGIGADVTDRAAMQRAVGQAVERFGRLDVVVANAGIANRAATFRAMPTETFERVIAVNQTGVVNTVEAALPQIVENKGHAVVISSVYAFLNGMGSAPYAMSKAAVEQFGRTLRVELAPHGASATTCYFGFIDTTMVHEALDADPLAQTAINSVPKALHKRLKPAVAGEAIVQGIEKRAARVVRPKRWALLSTLRGIVNPLTDRRILSDPTIQSVIREADSRDR